MKVRFSSEARQYLSREAAYLKERSIVGAVRFQSIVARARRQIESFPDAGYTDSIMVVRHSRNTPTVPLEDDVDPEHPATPSSSGRPGKK